MTSKAIDEILPDHCAKDVVVLCCGNVLFGDDGFGPAVAEKINRSQILPDWAVVIDVGTAVRGYLFDIIMSPRQPRMVIIVDAVDLRVDAVDSPGLGRTPGEVFEIPLNEIPPIEVSEFSVHQAPTSNLLQQLNEIGGIRVVILACQVESVPEEMSEEISPAVRSAVDKAVRLILGSWLSENG